MGKIQEDMIKAEKRGIDAGERGRIGENVACAYLERQGYEIVARNWRSRFGEIDIIAVKADLMAFVEVKYRRTDSYVLPRFAVNKMKRERLRKTALTYISENEVHGLTLQFDIIEISGEGELKVTHLENTGGLYV